MCVAQDQMCKYCSGSIVKCFHALVMFIPVNSIEMCLITPTFA